MESLWRFAIDGVRQHEGWETFEEKEPGYMRGILHSLFCELSTKNLTKPLSKDIILRVHQNALKGVSGTNYSKDNKKPQKSKFRYKSYASFGLHLGKNLSKDGFNEINKNYKYSDNFQIEKVVFGGTKSYQGQAICENPEKVVIQILKKYNKKMDELNKSKNTTDEQKVAYIVDMVTKLERLHPFRDANCRTFCMVILCRELLKVGIMPPILDDPNHFDGFSNREMRKKIQEGTKRSYDIIHSKKSPSFNTTLLKKRGALSYKPPGDYSDLTHINLFEFKNKKIDKKSELSIKGNSKKIYDLVCYDALLEMKANKDKIPFSSDKFNSLEKNTNEVIKFLILNLDKDDYDAYGAEDMLLGAITYGCNNIVKQIFDPKIYFTINKSDKSKYFKVLFNAIGLSNTNERKGLASSLEKYVIPMAVKYIKQNPNDVERLFSEIHTTNPDLAKEFLVKIRGNIKLSQDFEKVTHLVTAMHNYKNYIENNVIKKLEAEEKKSWYYKKYYRDKIIKEEKKIKIANKLITPYIKALTSKDTIVIDEVLNNMESWRDKKKHDVNSFYYYYDKVFPVKKIKKTLK